MNQNLQIDSKIIAEVDVDIKNVHGEYAVGQFLLRLNLKFHLKTKQELQISNFAGILKVVFLNDKNRVENKLGACIFESRSLQLNPNYSNGIYDCNFYFTPQQLAEIEKQRHGGDLLFYLSFNTFVDEYETNKHIEANAQFEFTLNQKKWLQILKQMKFTDYMLVEIPMPFLENVSSHREILTKFQKANELLYNGEYTLAVNECRSVLEGMEKKFGVHKNIKEIKDKFKNSPRKMALPERVVFFEHALKHLTQLAHHTNDAEDGDMYQDYSRYQAQLIVGNTGLILSYFMNQENKKINLQRYPRYKDSSPG